MPPLWYFGLILAAHVLSVNYARINPACECVVFQSLGGTEGRFHSPNFPQYYSKGIECILFTFIGDLGELIEIKFTEFDMLHPSYDSLCTDYLKLFLFLDRPEVNENSKHDYSLCGNMSSLPQKTFYSQGRSLIMEFHTTIPTRPFHRGFTGFRGFFKFLNASLFQSDGVKQSGTMCSWDFSSTQTSGKFFSPRYPQNYPDNSKCQYIFYGQPHEGTVKVQFQNIQIYNDGMSCSESPDRIAIYDGVNSSAPLLKYLCGIQNQEEVVSSSPYLYIEFYSNSRNHMKGFAANYTFQHRSFITSVSVDPVYSCNQEIYSSVSKEGEIKSQHYPQSYPSSTKCTYIFQGTPEERVQIKFIDVDLFYDGGKPDNPFDCDGQDSIRIYIKIDGDEKDIAYTCGKKIPKMYMSNIPWMKVVFESGSRTQPHTRGFRMEYRFLTNYGITTGKQDDRKICKFFYISKVRMNGYFVSPNFPGIYPKNTDCEFIFYGRNHEAVRVQFHEFDVDGVPPRCEPKDRVDYVDFSNFDGAMDKKMQKFCGQITNKIQEPIQSDQSFFRVIFKSNSMYEGKGFNASYQFVVREEMTTMKLPIGSNGAVSQYTNNRQNEYIYLVLFTISVFAMNFLQGNCVL